MGRLIRRRTFLAGVTGVLFGKAASQSVVSPAEAHAFSCSWSRRETRCYSGKKQERWCYRCCASATCNDEFCEWRTVGSC